MASFIDTAFNDCLFMWDSAFILLFARYGRRAFDFQRTLDNLYASQHPDGFICREIGTFDGKDRFERFDAASTGPNVMPWTEWEHYGDTADSDRLGTGLPCSRLLPQVAQASPHLARRHLLDVRPRLRNG